MDVDDAVGWFGWEGHCAPQQTQRGPRRRTIVAPGGLERHCKKTNVCLCAFSCSGEHCFRFACANNMELSQMQKGIIHMHAFCHTCSQAVPNALADVFPELDEARLPLLIRSSMHCPPTLFRTSAAVVTIALLTSAGSGPQNRNLTKK